MSYKRLIDGENFYDGGDSEVKCCFCFDVPTGFKVLSILSVLGLLGQIAVMIGFFSLFGSALVGAICGILGALCTIAINAYTIHTWWTYSKGDDTRDSRLTFVKLCNVMMVLTVLANVFTQIGQQQTYGAAAAAVAGAGVNVPAVAKPSLVGAIIGALVGSAISVGIQFWWRSACKRFAEEK